MPILFGREISKSELMQHVGCLDQVVSARRLEYQDGLAKSLQAIEVDNAELSFQLLPDKCLDIGSVRFQGIPLNYLAKTGLIAASWHPTGTLAGKSLMCGMLFTCGLSNVGPMEYDEAGVELPKHGLIRSTPAENVTISKQWRGEDYWLTIQGNIRETGLFESNLSMTRTVETCLGKTEIILRDEIENQGYSDAPCMLLYHFNLGYPLLDQESQLMISPRKTVPRDSEAQAGMDHWLEVSKPVPEFKEQVFYHTMPERSDGSTQVQLNNPKLNIGLQITYKYNELPNLVQWKSMAPGDYALGIEPANCYPEGLSKERQRGTLRILRPGEKLCTHLCLTIKNLNEMDPDNNGW